MYFERFIDKKLVQWKLNSNKKPLLLRGARQIGKTTAVRHLAKSFSYFVEINFDENPDLASLFNKNLNVDEICNQLEVLFNIPIVDNETLLFFDEIQACPNAIKSLRYFFEKKPQLHVIAAGSLLEFALAELSTFGVGRIEFIFFYPFSFEEFLMAMKEDLLLKTIKKATLDKPIPDVIHEKAVKLLKSFLIIGGLPEAVSTFAETKSYLAVQSVLDQLISTYQTDFSKYKSRVPNIRIQEVFRNAISQVGKNFSYSYNTTFNNYQIKESLELLQMAGLLYSVTHSASNGIPLGAEINPKKRKIIVFDTGVYQRLLGLDLSNLFLDDDIDLVNKGSIAELYVGLELLKNNTDILSGLYYWQRESKSSQAEVDYVVQDNYKIIPIEVKANKKGAMQSMYKFLEEKKLDFGIRTSLENFGKIHKIKIIPLYGIGIKWKDKFNL